MFDVSKLPAEYITIHYGVMPWAIQNGSKSVIIDSMRWQLLLKLATSMTAAGKVEIYHHLLHASAKCSSSQVSCSPIDASQSFAR